MSSSIWTRCAGDSELHPLRVLPWRAVEAQRFRPDLYYRLSVAHIDLPPLRERPGDILPLAEHFIGLYGQALGLSQAALAADAQAALLGYPWPGNVRELENVVHSALIVCRLKYSSTTGWLPGLRHDGVRSARNFVSHGK